MNPAGKSFAALKSNGVQLMRGSKVVLMALIHFLKQIYQNHAECLTYFSVTLILSVPLLLLFNILNNNSTYRTQCAHYRKNRRCVSIIFCRMFNILNGNSIYWIGQRSFFPLQSI